jgi:Protein of unknown function (DUF3617)
MKISALLLCFAGLMPLAASAQRLAPGLWEYTTAMKQQGGGADAEKLAKVQERMAQMSPGARAQLEQIMTKRDGKNGAEAFSLLSGKPTGSHVCVTPEQAARDYEPKVESRCKSEIVERSATSLRAKLVCTGEPPMSGETQYTMTGNKAFNGRILMNTQKDGKASQMEITQTGRWLAADCGDVKPLGTAAAAASAAMAPRAKP